MAFPVSHVSLFTSNSHTALSSQLLRLGRFLRDVESQVSDFVMDYPLSDRKED